MVRLWPFKAEDDSPASFEKALSALSEKITRTTNRLDLHRQHARRFKALWTLYTTFAYLLYSIILALVLGWQNWGIAEYAAVVGGPILIYTVRTGATRYYDYRITKTQVHLDALHKQRDTTIEKLKEATRYNSTQQLLEKYGASGGGGTLKRTKSRTGDDKRKSDASLKKRNQQQPQQPPVQRTGLPPPPTANIRRTPQQSPPQQQQQQQQYPPSPGGQYPPPPSSPFMIPGGHGHGRPQQAGSRSPDLLSSPPAFDEPGFAPNAFSSTPPQYIESSHWYDRLLDVLLGEDEMQPKNRMVLLCANCRLVNGQAPPGIKSLEELGRWRCGSCGAWNGQESEAKKVLAEIRNEPPLAAAAAVSTDAEVQSSVSERSDDGVIVAASEDEQVDSASDGAEGAAEEEDQSTGDDEQSEADQKEEPAPKTTTRGRGKGGKRKG
ncbi:uncharacterized protein BP01DRAFT_352363 [Aspergillus saccharolyticus JOP 1030-1]|uniref:Endoplasmic reticulum junction formation protein lunapark n=1 Tax=Aspergillus saccharolyticus JOP 1030-1 TaxID=1450539 RepID=A0A318ZQN8_9EURO|nr:hypothetical protein BP01DRAFT_352363 [Aspergillus saccharolyticus JOP 1030-1]PYH49826.1 hypothetical protein BP01DRAFT_352363 [Aspergillus saccharolyticus JOP 1030-1]